MSRYKYKIVVSDHEFDSLEIEKEESKRINAELIDASNKKEEEVVELISNADGILNMYYPISRQLMCHMKKCKIISRYGIGIDNIDISAATELGIMVTNVPSYCIDEVADHTLALLLCLVRKICLLDASVRLGVWDFKISQPIFRLKDKNLGLVGFGKIGQAVSRRARAFGLKVLVYDPYVKEEFVRELQCERVTFEHLLSYSDFISIHCPLNEETRKMFSYEEFKKMKRRAFLINTSRGGIVDTEALYKALKEKSIAGAGVDVIEGVPPMAKELPLLHLDNLIITPHSAWYSEESMKELRKSAVQEIVRVLSGHIPLSLVNSEVIRRKI